MPASTRGHRTYYIRVGSTSREASREELARMYQASGQLLYGLKLASGADLDVLDRRRLREWLTRIVGETAPDDEDVDKMGDAAGQRRSDDRRRGPRPRYH